MDLLGFSVTNEIFSIPNLFLIGVGIFWMIVASIQDIRKREVENWWNFSLIIFVLAFRALLSVETWNYWYFLWGIIGLAGGFVLANAFYYGRLFAGGDAKLLMALGTILPLSLSWQTNLNILILFLILFLFAGSIYGLFYSFGMMIFHFNNFQKEFSKQFKKYYQLIIYIELFNLILILICLLTSFYFGLTFCVILFLSPFLLIYARAIEEACMIKLVSKKDLTIGDWLYKPIKIGNKIIKPNWEGLNENELVLINKKLNRKIFIKQGLPFVPSFLIAFILLLLICYYLF